MDRSSLLTYGYPDAVSLVNSGPNMDQAPCCHFQIYPLRAELWVSPFEAKSISVGSKRNGVGAFFVAIELATWSFRHEVLDELESPGSNGSHGVMVSMLTRIQILRAQ